jgi:hypothetical protein
MHVRKGQSSCIFVDSPHCADLEGGESPTHSSDGHPMQSDGGFEMEWIECGDGDRVGYDVVSSQPHFEFRSDVVPDTRTEAWGNDGRCRSSRWQRPVLVQYPGVRCEV